MKRFYTFFVVCLVLSCWLNVANAQIVQMPDENLAAAVRDALNLRPGIPITRQLLQGLQTLDAPQRNIKDLTGLEHATQLEGLWVWSNQIRDIAPLANLIQLRWVGLSDNQISDITPLKNLTQLRHLELWENEISDITPLVNLTQLDWLHLSNNQISDITPLKNLTRLEGLFLWGNEISDITPLANLTRLSHLSFGGNQIDDISLIARFTRLEELYIGHNNISDITPLASLSRLQILGAWQNEISDISPLRKLTRLRNLDLSRNFISDISPLSGLRVLEKLTLWDNSIRDVSALAGLTRLKELRLANNPIQDGTPLRTLLERNPNLELDIDPTLTGNAVMPDPELAAVVRSTLGLGANARITRQAMQGLTRLDARESQIKNLTGLEHATRLTELILYNNQISDVSPLVGLTRLRYLGLDGNQISDTRPISKLTQLELLHIGDNRINNAGVRPLTKLKQLKWLALHSNKISNITPLAKLTKLEGLWIGGNKIRDVSPLAGLVNLRTLHLRGNPVQDFSPLSSLTNLSDVDFSASDAGIGFTTAGPKIEGPWLWMIVPTGRIGGEAAAKSGKDYLSVATKGSVTEAQIATNGATAGDRVKNRKWTLGQLAPTGGDNITQTLKAIGLVRGVNVDNQVAYGSIALDSPRRQKTTMYAGSDDAVKVWLNGELVHDNPIDRAASEYQDSFSVTLNKGKNILLVAVYEAAGTWSGFFGFENDAVYSLLTTPVVQIGPAQRPPLYWMNAEAGTLHRLVGAEVENLAPSAQNVTSLVLNSADNKIYWTEQVGKNKGRIKRANLNGSNVRVLANILNGVPRNIAVDSRKGKLYWTNSRGRIQRSNLNGKQIRNLIQNLESPDRIIVDAAGGKLYWTETAGRIRRANLSGRSIEDIASGLNPVVDIAIYRNKLYWSEVASESSGTIGRANLNGSNFGTLARLQTPALSIAIDAAGNKLYWSDLAGNIRRSNLNGKRIQNVVLGLTFPVDLAASSLGTRSAAAPANGSLVSAQSAIPETTGLLANYPNPFNPETWIPYQLTTDTDVRILIYDARGILVRRLELGHQPAGTYTSRSRAAYWDGRNEVGESVASGVYFYTLTAGDFSATRKMLILK